MDGYTATKKLRAIPVTKKTPIIALTANTLEEHKERCWEAGMNDHIAKPFNKQSLANIISEWL